MNSSMSLLSIKVSCSRIVYKTVSVLFLSYVITIELHLSIQKPANGYKCTHNSDFTCHPFSSFERAFDLILNGRLRSLSARIER